MTDPRPTRSPKDPIVRGELHDALRFVYGLLSQSQEQLDGMDAILGALTEVLISKARLDPREVERLLPEARKALDERRSHEVSVDVSKTVDKYALVGPADLDCASLIPICKGRCCKLTFSLSFQDLDEGKLRWDYAEPYRILHADDGYCVHTDAATRGCTVYETRPAICRVYDCRDDRRIWTDFEKRIPAPDTAIKPQAPRLYSIRRSKPTDDASRMEDAVELPTADAP